MDGETKKLKLLELFHESHQVTSRAQSPKESSKASATPPQRRPRRPPSLRSEEEVEMEKPKNAKLCLFFLLLSTPSVTNEP